MLCAACSLGGKRPDYRYYVLGPHAPSRAPDRGYAVAIQRVTVPGYLEREEIATRTVESRVVYSPTDRWAEPLDRAIERTLREDLAARGIPVQSQSGNGAYDLSVDVLRFERTGPEQVDLWARWTLTTGERTIERGQAMLRVVTARADSSATAAALSEAISQLASQIASRASVATREP